MTQSHKQELDKECAASLVRHWLSGRLLYSSRQNPANQSFWRVLIGGLFLSIKTLCDGGVKTQIFIGLGIVALSTNHSVTVHHSYSRWILSRLGTAHVFLTFLNAVKNV